MVFLISFCFFSFFCLLREHLLFILNLFYTFVVHDKSLNFVLKFLSLWLISVC